MPPLSPPLKAPTGTKRRASPRLPPGSRYRPSTVTLHRHTTTPPSLLSHLLCYPLLALPLLLPLLGEPGLAGAAAAPSRHALGSGWTPDYQGHTQFSRPEHRPRQEQGSIAEQGSKAEQGSRGEQGLGAEQGLRLQTGLVQEQGLRGEQGLRVEHALGQEGGVRAEQGLRVEGGRGPREGEQAAAARADQHRREASRRPEAAQARLLQVRKASALPLGSCSLLPVYDITGKVIRNSKGQPVVQKDWSSWADTSSFQAGPCLTVSAIHMVQTPAKTVVVIDRSDAGTGYSLPGAATPRRPFYAVELTLATGVQRPLDIIKDAFCSTGTLMPDGSLVNIGGFQLGVASMRGFQPCTDGSCDFEILGKLKSGRWYPSSQLLGSGRVLIVGGQRRSGAINVPQLNSPTVEYWPPGPEGLVAFPFLTRTLPQNQYPIVHLLPSGLVFIFAGQEYTLFDTSTNKEAPRRGGYPALRLKDSLGRPIFRCSPSSAASALLPLSPDNGHRAEVIICGGPRGTFHPVGPQVLETADDMCWRIFPDSTEPAPAWVGDPMCYDWPGCAARAPRVMGQAVLLADGSMLLVGGATKGFAGYRTPGPPALQPLLYFPGSRTWYTKPLATSYVPRLYHSTALLLHDATVLVAGSGPNLVENTTKLYYPTESRTERFFPPYLQRGPSPAFTSAPSSAAINSLFSVCFQSAHQHSNLSEFRFALSFSGFSTHGLRSGQRYINLEISAIASQGNRMFGATLKSPPNLNIAPPTSYWLFILERGVPNREGKALKITPPQAKENDQTFHLSTCEKE